MTNSSEHHTCDLLIVGGGLVGLSLARASSDAGLDVLVADREAPKKTESDSFDGRVSSVAKGSSNMLRCLGLWEAIGEEAQPIEEIRITDSASPFFLHYDSDDVGNGPMGYIIENRILRQALHEIVAKDPRICWHTAVEVENIQRKSHGIFAQLSNGKQVEASLVVAADGRHSSLRSEAGINVIKHSYNQVGIVCTVSHTLPHCGVAHERFLSGGPFAILPMTGNRSSLVWTEDPTIASAILKLCEEKFLEELSWRFGEFLGKLEVVSPRWHYPLELLLARELTSKRFALVGDSAHAIHPIAGQGLNLGLRNAAALAELLGEAKGLGMDVGDSVVLDRYARWRRFDGLTMAAVTDGLYRIFSSGWFPVQGVRGIGLATVNRLPFLKKTFQRHAMGVLGDLPRLLKDEAVEW